MLIELLLLAIPFALLRYRLIPEENAAGSEANLAFFGVALLLLGLFNLVFFSRHYRNTDRVGVPFLQGCAVFAVGMLLAETAASCRWGGTGSTRPTRLSSRRSSGFWRPARRRSRC